MNWHPLSPAKAGGKMSQLIQTMKPITKKSSILFALGLLSLMVSPAAHARIIFQDDVDTTGSESHEIGSDDSTASTDITLQFGGTLGETLLWDSATQAFTLSDDLTVDGNFDLNGTTLTLDADNAGAGANLSIVANQGSDSDGALTYDATDNRWEISNDGGTAVALGTLNGAYDLETGAGERTVTVDNGDVSWDITAANNFVVDVQGTGGLLVQDGGVTFASFTQNGDLDLTNNLTVGANAETISNGSFTLDGNDAFIEDSLGVEGAIYSDATATKYVWLDIFGSVRGSATAGSVAGGQSAVVRFDSGGNSRMRYAVPVPDDWEAGTDMTLRVYWSPSDNTAGAIDFDLEFASFAVGETLAGGSFTDLIGGAVFETVNITTELQLYETTITFPNASIAADDMMNFRLSRTPGDAGDTYGADINIHMMRLEYSGKKIQ